jgi:hypothetical protein
MKHINKTFTRQLDQTDCGVACLLSILHYYGPDATRERLHESLGTSIQGTSLPSLLQTTQLLVFTTNRIAILFRSFINNVKNLYVFNRLTPLLFTCFVFLGTRSANSQNTIQGQIEDGSTNNPVVLASVFLSNTTKGVLSNENGKFVINQVPSGNYDLIVSCVGYETVKININTKALLRYRIVLKPAESQLTEFRVTSKKSKKWFRDLDFFKEKFLGLNENSISCLSKNENILFFKDSVDSFKAYAKELIEIENRALGYKIKYALVQFDYDKVNMRISYRGYPLFEPLVPENNEQAKIWKTSRRKSYLGSIRHFMKSLYTCSLEADGFIVKNIQEKIDKSGKPRIITQHGEQLYFYPTPADTIVRLVETDTLVCEQLVRKSSTSNSKTIFTIKNPIQVTYTKENESISYQKFNNPPQYGYNKTPQVSIVHLTSPSVTIEPDGHFHDPSDIVFELYWSWELLGDLLPFEYD